MGRLEMMPLLLLLLHSSSGLPAAAAAAALRAPALRPGLIAQERKHDVEARVFMLEDGTMAVSSPSSAGADTDWVARGGFNPSKLRKSDFAELRITTSSAFSDAKQMRAAGFAEGYLTAAMLADHWHNMQWFLSQSIDSTDELLKWLEVQDQWTRQQIQANKGDAFFDAAGLLMEQFEGLVQGYAAAARAGILTAAEPPLQLPVIDSAGFLLLNAFGDIDDLLEMLAAGDLRQAAGERPPTRPTLSPGWDSASPGQAAARIAKRGHCSALVKVTPDLSDILIAHNTWWSFSSMLRIYKHYDFAGLTHPAVKSKAMSFASYPGALSSIDDWYILDTQLVVTETSNNIYDTQLYRLSTNKAALSWHRTRVANMLSETGADWARHVTSHASGTYNNQYLVVDLKRFRPFADLRPGLLTVIETMPGGAVSADTTSELARGYWPSYNIPYFGEVYNASGYGALRQHLAARGPPFSEVQESLSYQLAPRAKIFRRDSGPVTSLDALKQLMRSNGWPRDPLSTSPWNAVAARGDLSPDTEERDASGAYDCKVTNYRLALRMSAEAVNGPTWGGALPPFAWADWPHVAHRGMRPVFDTEWEVQEP